MATFEEIVDGISDVTELRRLMGVCDERLKVLSRRMATTLKVGTSVKWDGRAGRHGTGKITKINQLTCLVKCDQDGRIWKITASVLVPYTPEPVVAELPKAEVESATEEAIPAGGISPS